MTFITLVMTFITNFMIFKIMLSEQKIDNNDFITLANVRIASNKVYNKL